MKILLKRLLQTAQTYKCMHIIPSNSSSTKGFSIFNCQLIHVIDKKEQINIQIEFQLALYQTKTSAYNSKFTALKSIKEEDNLNYVDFRKQYEELEYSDISS